MNQVARTTMEALEVLFHALHALTAYLFPEHSSNSEKKNEEPDPTEPTVAISERRGLFSFGPRFLRCRAFPVAMFVLFFAGKTLFAAPPILDVLFPPWVLVA
jgi:hypothetical protein